MAEFQKPDASLPSGPPGPATDFLRLSDFAFERAILEIRYPNAFELWDRSGALWIAALQKWNDLQVVSAEPSRTVFRGKQFELSTELQAARIVQHNPVLPLADFTGFAKEFVELVSGTLSLSVLSRVGLRLTFFRRVADRASETSALLRTGLLKPVQPGLFGIEGEPVSMDYRARWEGKGLGVTLRLGHEDRAFTMQGPAELAGFLREKGLEEQITFAGLVLDVDFYTPTSIQVSQLGVAPWIRQHVKTLKEDAEALFTAVDLPGMGVR